MLLLSHLDTLAHRLYVVLSNHIEQTAVPGQNRSIQHSTSHLAKLEKGGQIEWGRRPNRSGHGPTT
jgi:hypothetical protein